jgi:hypothetical protein
MPINSYLLLLLKEIQIQYRKTSGKSRLQLYPEVVYHTGLSYRYNPESRYRDFVIGIPQNRDKRRRLLLDSYLY